MAAAVRCGPWLAFYNAILNNNLCGLKKLMKRHQNVVDLNKHFIEAGREVHLGVSPIHLAAYLGHSEILGYLLEQQHCNIEVGTVARRTAFHIAVACHQMDCCHLLLSAGSNYNPVDMFNNSPLHYAAEDGACDMLDLLLLKGACVDSRDSSGKTPLMKATRGGRVSAVQRLLHSACEVNAKDMNHDTALHFAARRGDCNLIHIIMSSGGDINSQNSTGRTPLLEALSCNNHEVAQQLLDLRCDVNLHEFTTKDTALHVAVGKGNISLTSLLLRQNQILNKYNFKNELPVYRAIIRNNADIIKTFLSMNFDLESHVKVVGGLKKNVADVAYESGQFELLQLFQELGFRVSSTSLPHRNIGLAPTYQKGLVVNVPTLRRLCRKNLRKFLGCGIADKTDALPLPSLLKDYLLLRDLATFVG